MKHAIWFVRLVYAAWMVPAGLNHFYPMFPQPLGNQPESHELIVALIDSHLFTLVKAIELFVGLCVLTGFFVPLALVMALPISISVFYWDTALQGWTSGSAIYGWAVLGCNVVLLAAYWRSYRGMFANGRSRGSAKPLDHPSGGPPPRSGEDLYVLLGRILFGAWLAASGINHFFLGVVPVGSTPLASQLIDALLHSGLYDVVMAMELAAGALILAGLFVPAALCLMMPISVCTVYWAAGLNHQPIGAALALFALALNGLLMLAHLDRYRGVLQRRALAAGETDRASYESRFVDIGGRTPGRDYPGALVPLLLAAAFYYFLVPPIIGLWNLPVLLFPALVLHVRCFRGMVQVRQETKQV
jgi:uncharacterized membrane protein YphA (DoxX/SURF4 family)